MQIGEITTKYLEMTWLDKLIFSGKLAKSRRLVTPNGRRVTFYDISWLSWVDFSQVRTAVVVRVGLAQREARDFLASKDFLFVGVVQPEGEDHGRTIITIINVPSSSWLKCSVCFLLPRAPTTTVERSTWVQELIIIITTITNTPRLRPLLQLS